MVTPKKTPQDKFLDQIKKASAQMIEHNNKIALEKAAAQAEADPTAHPEVVFVPETALTYAVTIEPSSKGGRFQDVVVVVMQGQQIVKRHVWESIEGVDPALDVLCRIATRIYYFGEGREHSGGEV